MATDKSLEALFEERLKLYGRDENIPDPAADRRDVPSVALSPGMQKSQDSTTEDLWKELNRTPLFMTSLDETDGADGENIALEALKALAYEGTRAEVAQNFREQGTELVRYEKRYLEAREYYTKALEALKRPPLPPDPEEGPEVIEIDEEAEAKREREIEEACLTNRALCNLEMKNYGSCNRDCAAALRMNPRNIKAWYRAASACLALDKIPEALDACQSGLVYDADNVALKALSKKIEKRQDELAEMERFRKERLERQELEQATLRLAIKNRKIPTRKTDRPPEMPEAKIELENALDPSASLSFPVILLYPVHAQTDFVKGFREEESLNDHLSYILPLPWDDQHEYVLDSVECYMETIEGGLIKAGKKLSLLKLLSSGKLEVVDGLVRISVVPKDKAAGWVEDFKKRKGQQ